LEDKTKNLNNFISQIPSYEKPMFFDLNSSERYQKNSLGSGNYTQVVCINNEKQKPIKIISNVRPVLCSGVPVVQSGSHSNIKDIP